MHLSGKWALITGATSGIGKAITERFAAEGASICALGRSQERGDELVKKLRSQGTEAIFRAIDLGDREALQTSLEDILAQHPIDILVHAAGITKDALLLRMSWEDWEEVIRVNLSSTYLLCKALIKPMIKARSGSIVTLSSLVGISGNAGQMNYAASKAGIIGLTKSLAREVASRGIRLNCIAPGFIKTPMTSSLAPTYITSLCERIPMKRFGEPEEVAQLALFLASSQASYITGQVFCIDGGGVL